MILVYATVSDRLETKAQVCASPYITDSHLGCTTSHIRPSISTMSPPEVRLESWNYRYLAIQYDAILALLRAQDEPQPFHEDHADLESQIHEQAAIIESQQAELNRLNTSATVEVADALLATQMTLRTDLENAELENSILRTQIASLQEQLDTMDQQNRPVADAPSAEPSELNFADRDPSPPVDLTPDAERLRSRLIEMEKKFDISEDKLQRCWEERQQMDIQLETAKDERRRADSLVTTLERKIARLTKEKNEGCEKRCEDLKRRLCRLVKAIDVHGTAVKDIALEVGRGLDCEDLDEEDEVSEGRQGCHG